MLSSKLPLLLKLEPIRMVLMGSDTYPKKTKGKLWWKPWQYVSLVYKYCVSKQTIPINGRELHASPQLLQCKASRRTPSLTAMKNNIDNTHLCLIQQEPNTSPKTYCGFFSCGKEDEMKPDTSGIWDVIVDPIPGHSHFLCKSKQRAIFMTGLIPRPQTSALYIPSNVTFNINAWQNNINVSHTNIVS